GGHAGLLEESGDARRRLTSTLLVAAALSAAFLVGLVWDHQLPDQRTFPEIYWPLVAGALVLMAGSAVAYAVAPTALGQAGILAGALTAAMNLLGTVQAHDAEWNGVSMFAIGAGW